MKILIGFIKLLSLLPMRALYVLSDLFYPIVYYVARYRRAVVRKNIETSFPEKSVKELRKVECDFYHFFCDYVVETIKLLSMSEKEMRRRMVVEGVDLMEDSLTRCPFVFIFLGHYCNWEWISSIPLWRREGSVRCGQLYRPLKNKAFDGMFLQLRERFGAECISKYDALRHIIKMKKDGERAMIGFISDQSPSPVSIHEWADFLHHDTPVFTGTERIGKKVGAAIYFADVERVKRGYYRLSLRRMTEDAKSYPDYALTQWYMQELEKIIHRQPHLWLWSHKRWKHTRESVAKVQNKN